MNPRNDQRRPGRGSGVEKVNQATTAIVPPHHDDPPLFEVDEHGAIIAADAAQGWKVHITEQAIRAAAAAGRVFGADEIEVDTGVPSDGNWVGGVYMRLHRAGVIRPAGYRPSSKKSRAGSIVTLWTGGDSK